MEKKPSLPVDLCGGRRLLCIGAEVIAFSAGDFAFLLVRLAAHFLTHFFVYRPRDFSFPNSL
ncbi:MAG: hypothetical protein SOT57_06015 [Eubacteriales bacterium]|nr:hypothetical protein [Eubacteriales bacterium]